MQRLDKKFSVLFLDIDYFKKVNDTSGHWIGSRLLVEVSRIILGSVRSCDYAFRYGGDEFVVVLVDTTREQGETIAERIRRAIEQHEFLIDSVSLKLTVSIGLAIFPDHAKSTVELLKLADQAMYYGKTKSRNIVFPCRLGFRHERWSKKIKLVVSDLHLGVGRVLENGQLNSLEEFYFDEKFVEFLHYYTTGRYADYDVELIMNGDILNFLQVDYHGHFLTVLTESISMDIIKRIINGHPLFIKALKEFASKENHTDYVCGR